MFYKLNLNLFTLLLYKYMLEESFSRILMSNNIKWTDDHIILGRFLEHSEATVSCDIW